VSQVDELFGSRERYLKGRFLTSVAKRQLWSGYIADPNVIGAGFGRRAVRDEFTDEPAIVVYVIRKVPEQFIPPSRLLPRRVYVGRDAVEVDVVETGPIYPQSFTARERPAPAGISVGHTAVTAGTLGAWVIDNTDGTQCILSNNHILANENAASVGDAIVQPGIADGGATPADDIATLKRFVTILLTGSTVDCAIAQVTNAADVLDQVKDNLMPVATREHPPIGLLFAGSCNRTLMNRIDNVVNQLNIAFPSGAAAAAPDVGVNVEKVGRTTEYTTSTITEIDISVMIPYDFGNVTLDQQFATAWMSEGGDSGSLVCVGGSGGNEDHCACATQSAAAALLGMDLSVDAAVESEFRGRYLQQTRVGRWGIDVYFLNEPYLIDRLRKARVREEDRDFARYLYDKHINEARRALLDPRGSDLRLSDEHLRDAREALGRARQYMNQEEADAAEELMRVVYEARGRTAAEILDMLNDEALFRRVQGIVSRVESIRTPEPKPDDDKEREQR
jgi:hypothetical protein